MDHTTDYTIYSNSQTWSNLTHEKHELNLSLYNAAVFVVAGRKIMVEALKKEFNTLPSIIWRKAKIKR